MPQGNDRTVIELTVRSLERANPAAVLEWAKSMPTPDQVTIETRAEEAALREKRAAKRRAAVQRIPSRNGPYGAGDGSSKAPMPSPAEQPAPTEIGRELVLKGSKAGVQELAGPVFLPADAQPAGRFTKLGVGSEPSGRPRRGPPGRGRGKNHRGR